VQGLASCCLPADDHHSTGLALYCRRMSDARPHNFAAAAAAAADVPTAVAGVKMSLA